MYFLATSPHDDIPCVFLVYHQKQQMDIGVFFFILIKAKSISKVLVSLSSVFIPTLSKKHVMLWPQWVFTVMWIMRHLSHTASPHHFLLSPCEYTPVPSHTRVEWRSSHLPHRLYQLSCISSP